MRPSDDPYYRKAKRDARRAAGLCPTSGCQRKPSRYTTCDYHYALMKRSADNQRRMRQANGDCRIAGCEDPTRGFAYCEYHRERRRRRKTA